MIEKTDKNKKHIYIFLALAFGISWTVALIIFLSGGLVNSPELIPGTGITLAYILLVSVYMWGPAFAHILTRLITRESWQDAYLKPNIKSSWPWWLAGWLGPTVLIILGSALFFVLLPNYFDPTMDMIKSQLGNGFDIANTIQFIIMQTVIAALISPLINVFATFGEEFGWRAYLLPKLAAFGTRKALIFSSLIWGVWHWPVVLMGHNYGLDYWGYPWSGFLATLWFILSVGIFIGWLTLKAHSVWPAVIAHGALNGMAAIGMLFTNRPPPMLLGPTPAGVIGVLPFTLLSLLILIKFEKKDTGESPAD